MPIVIESTLRELVKVGEEIPIRIRSDGFMSLETRAEKSQI